MASEPVLIRFSKRKSSTPFKSSSSKVINIGGKSKLDPFIFDLVDCRYYRFAVLLSSLVSL